MSLANATRVRSLLALCVSITGLEACGSSAAESSHAGTMATGSGTGNGTVATHRFGAVRSAYFIGRSDDPANTIVIYVFDATVACSALSSPGWDSRILDGTGALEMKLLGTDVAEYPVSSSPTGASGEASVNFTLSSTTATPQEESSTSGSVKLASVTAGKSASGTFDLVFPSGSLRGTFDAAWCANGHEP